MWAQRLIAPRHFEVVDAPRPTADDLAAGEVLVKLGAAGICGSDVPKYLGKIDPDNPWNGQLGVPIHEVVGEVIASKSDALLSGQRVVGIAERSRGLQERFRNPDRYLHPLDGDDLTDAEATVIQPVATILSALSRLPPLAGRRVAVIGLGPLGVIFTQVIKSRGAAAVIGVDVVDRTDVAAVFGIDEVVTSASRPWAESLRDDQRPTIVIEAVGQQQGTLTDAITAVAPHGHIFAFGLPSDDHYAVPFRALFRKNLTLHAGTTEDWRRFLAEAECHVLTHRDVFTKRYITNVLPVRDAEAAFELYSRPAAGRLKVVLTA